VLARHPLARHPGKFIVFEGLDGSGTTTQAGLLAGYLFGADKHNDPLTTREPTYDEPDGARLRRCLTNDLLSGETKPDSPQGWAQLFVDDRKSHDTGVIQPHLARGHPVICDRYALSTIGYQGTKKDGVPGVDIGTLVDMHQGIYVPDLTLFLKVPAEVAMARRLGETTSDLEHFEGIEFQRALERTYDDIVIPRLREEHNIVVINGILPIEDVAAEVNHAVDKLFGYDREEAA
jgi:dTMP kinase